jgi:hypothetical protein
LPLRTIARTRDPPRRPADRRHHHRHASSRDHTRNLHRREGAAVARPQALAVEPAIRSTLPSAAFRRVHGPSIWSSARVSSGRTASARVKSSPGCSFVIRSPAAHTPSGGCMTLIDKRDTDVYASKHEASAQG